MDKVTRTDAIVKLYDGFVDALLSRGFSSYRALNSEKVGNMVSPCNKHFYYYGAVSFTERDGRLLSTYVSLHNSTVTGIPEKIFIIEYDVYTYAGRSRIISHNYIDENSAELLDKLVNDISTNIDRVELTVQYENMKFISFGRVDTAIFKDKHGKLHMKDLMECELIHPSIIIEKPEEY